MELARKARMVRTTHLGLESRECLLNSERHGNYEHFRKTMEVYVPHIRHVVTQFTQWTTEPPTISKELTSLLSPTVIYLTRQALFEGVEDLAKLAISSSESGERTGASGHGDSSEQSVLSLCEPAQLRSRGAIRQTGASNPRKGIRTQSRGHDSITTRPGTHLPQSRYGEGCDTAVFERCRSR